MTSDDVQDEKRMMRRVVLSAALGLGAATWVFAPTAFAQGTPTAGASSVSPAMDRAVARARAALDNGDGADARAVLDSLVSAAATGSNDLAEALFWRATLAERISDAERDWKRLVIEVPLASRAPDALMRLGELEMLRGHPADARTYFARVVREYPTGPAKARSQLWIAKSWMAERDLPRACVALTEASATGVPEGELRLQAEEMGRQCATVDRKAMAKVASGVTSPAGEARATDARATDARAAEARTADARTAEAKTAEAKTAEAKTPDASRGKYSVQLAAFDTREEGERLVKNLAGRGIDARVDGDVKPFRVRTGYYATRAEASSALAALRKRGQAGFVAELAK